MGNLRHRINGTCSVCYFCKEKLELEKCYAKGFCMTKTPLIQLIIYLILSMTTKPLQSKKVFYIILQFKSSLEGYCWLKDRQGNYNFILAWFHQYLWVSIFLDLVKITVSRIWKFVGNDFILKYHMLLDTALQWTLNKKFST